ncbi:MAG: hypothetical protein QW728_02225, partial [Thermoplasmata archaeon]
MGTINKILSYIITKLRGEEYTSDKAIGIRDFILVMYERGLQILRGMVTKFLFKKSKGLCFIGRNVKILGGYNIIHAPNFRLEDNCYVNAISRKGIIVGKNVSIGRGSIIECTGVLKELGEGLI